MKSDQDSLVSDHRARVCMPTWRRIVPTASRCTLYEAQDVFASVDDVDVVSPEATGTWKWKQHVLRRLLPRDFTNKLIPPVADGIVDVKYLAGPRPIQ